MDQLGQRLIPKGIDMDLSPLYIPSDKAYFLKGVEIGWTKTGSAEEIKPAESNFLYCSVDLPTGINTVIGYHYFAEGNEGYVMVHNSENNHLLYRLRGIDSTSEIVYRFCPTMQGIVNDPRYYFSKGRMAIKSLCKFLPDGKKQLYKELVMVNKKVENIRIVVEDAIATDGFSTDFFTPHDSCCGDRCRLIKTGVPTPLEKINIVPIAATADDKLKQNKMLFKMFQFRFVDENAWGQRSEHGLVSEPYFNNLASCSRDSQSQPHCVWLETKTPCPEIVKRTVLVKTCELKNGGIGTDGNVLSDWKEVFTFDLYNKSNPNLKWYERSYNKSSTDFEFFNDGKNIRIKFCNDRECKTVASSTIRSQNPAPFRSGTVASLANELIYGDNENSFDKFSVEDIASIKLRLDATQACEQKYARIRVYAVVHNIFENQNNPIYERNGKTTFGGYGQVVGAAHVIRFEENVEKPEGTLTSGNGHGQYFPDGVKGFRGRLSGTNYTAESKQYLYDASGISLIGVLKDGADKFTKEVGWGRKWAVQEFDFGNVPCGTYFFEINGHNDTDNVEKTSTYYIHTTTFNYYNQHWGVTQNYQKRIFIDTSAGAEYNGLNNDLAVIADLTRPQNLTSNGSHVVRGYIFEDKDNKIPIENLDVRSSLGGNYISSGFTDHNGFYFALNFLPYKVQLFGTYKCAFNYLLGQTGNKTSEGTSLASPIYVSEKIISYATDACNRWHVRGKISECGNGVNSLGGIEGIAVIMRDAAVAYTNSKGEFNLIAHFANGRSPQSMIFSVSNCYVLDCNCQPIKVVQSINQPGCINCGDISVNIGNFNLQTIVTHGNVHGSREQVGIQGHDWLGRHTDIQTDASLFINFPSEQEQGNATYPKLKVVLPDQFSADLCSRFKKLTFFLSKNTNFEDFFEWAADKVDFIDASGNKNAANPSKVKIWYRSLNEYNILRGSNTNSTWSIVDTNKNTRVGDIVEFIKNVDGKYLPVNTIGNVEYDSNGSYFLVDYDDSLKDLKDGVKFKLKRQYACEIQKTFYEYGFSVNFCSDCRPRDENGNVVKEFDLNIFSSYMLPRQIPVVTDVEEIIPASNGTTQIKTTQTKAIKSYPFSFEHHSPSDTWGDHCHSGGRVGYVNPYEGKKCDRTQFLITKALNEANDGAINFLHYFSLDAEFVLDEAGFGAISAILVRDDGQVLVICEFTAFSFRFNDDRAVVTEDGYVKLPTNQRFSRPDRNPSFNFGCQEKDLNTIQRIDSLVTFLDSNKQAIVLHDFANAEDVSPGVQSWLYPAIKEVRANTAKYWHSCFDTRLNKLFITKFNLDNREYVNNELDKNIQSNETIYFDYVKKQWGQMAHYTPEYFGGMDSDNYDKQFFSFKNALPWAHHNAVTPAAKYLNYFNEQCFPVIGVVTNDMKNADEKSFVSNTVYCSQILFILEKLETSMGQKSKVYEGQWERGAGNSNAPYLCDTENVDQCNLVTDMLFDGDTIYGRWLKALYVPEPTYSGEYFVMTAIISYFFGRDNGNG